MRLSPVLLLPLKMYLLTATGYRKVVQYCPFKNLESRKFHKHFKLLRETIAQNRQVVCSF